MATPDQLPPSVLAGIKETMGAAVIGGVLSCTIYGITVLQTYTYFRRYQNDSTALKALVGILFVLDTLTTGCVAAGLYGYMVTDFLRPDLLGVTPVSLGIEEGVTVLIATIVQLFFAHRLWAFSKQNWWLASIIVVLALASFGPGIGITVHLFTHKDIFSIGAVEVRILSGFANGLAAICDLLIAIGLMFYLKTSRTGYKHTDTIVDKLMLYAINRGALTTLCQTGHLVSTIAFPGHFYFVPFAWCLGKFYCNTLLATLNVRKSLRNGDSDTAVESGSHIMASKSRQVQRTYDRGGESHATIEFVNINKDPAAPYKGTYEDHKV